MCYHRNRDRIPSGRFVFLGFKVDAGPYEVPEGPEGGESKQKTPQPEERAQKIERAAYKAIDKIIILNNQIPTLESLKDNWGPGNYLSKIITQRGLNVKTFMADRSGGLTGVLKILPDPRFGPDYIESGRSVEIVLEKFEDEEVIQGYSVKLTIDPNNRDIISYEFLKRQE